MAKGRKTGGRQAGTPNKATAEIKELAAAYGPAALKELHRIGSESASDAARVSALTVLLDRGFGKPAQAIVGDEASPLKMVHEIRMVPVDAGR